MKLTEDDNLEESFETAQQAITPQASIGGMGEVSFPDGDTLGSGDVPSVADIDDDEEEAKKDKTKKKLEMEALHLTFDSFLNELNINEGNFEGVADLVKALHFELDPKTAEEMKIELGKRQGELVVRTQIEGGNYSLKRFRKEIKYGSDNKNIDLGVFVPGTYTAAVSTLGDGPHAKAAKKIKWNQKKYDQWLEDVASNDGWKNASDMAQNANNEPGLIAWVKKNNRGEDAMQRIQWDIEAFAESVVTEAALTIPGMAAMLLGLGIATRIGLMSDEKYNKMVGSIIPTAKAIIKTLPIIGNKVRNQELKDYQTKEVEKYLKDEISDKDIVAILNENPKLKKAIEDVATSGLNYKDYYQLIKELGGAANKWGDAHRKFKQLRKKISDGKVLESVNEKTISIDWEDDENAFVFSDAGMIKVDYDGQFKYRGKWFDTSEHTGPEDLIKDLNKAFKADKFVYENETKGHIVNEDSQGTYTLNIKTFEAFNEGNLNEASTKMTTTIST